MAKDGRLYAKFTLDFVYNPKIKPLSSDAFRCLVEATIWSRTHLTDGFLPRALALACWSLEALNELSANDTRNPSLIVCEEGWQIHDFAAHQTTKAELDDVHRHAVSAGRKGGQASAQARATASAQAKRKQQLKQNPSKIKPETLLANTYGISSTDSGETCAPNGARTTANCTRCDSDGRVELEPGITARCTHPEGALRET